MRRSLTKMPSVQVMPTRLARAAEDVGDEARGGRLAVDAGDGDDRNAAVLAVREEDVDDRLADRPRDARPTAPGASASPGAALTSTITPPCSPSGREMSWATTSTPAMSRPTILAASTAQAATAGCTRSVTSMAVPPVLRLALRRISTIAPAGGTESGVKP